MAIELRYQIGEEIKTVTIKPEGDRFQVTIGDTTYSVATRQLERDHLGLEVDGQPWQAYVMHKGSRRYVALAGETWMFEQASTNRSRPRGARAGALAALDSLEATMPGVVLELLVAEGDRVERGQTLVLLEAMKMELRVTTPCNGQVRKLHCAAGQTVERGQILVEIEAE